MSVPPNESNNDLKFPAQPQPAQIEEFEYAAYARCSDNNMPIFTSFVPLTEEEQREADAALAINKPRAKS